MVRTSVPMRTAPTFCSQWSKCLLRRSTFSTWVSNTEKAPVIVCLAGATHGFKATFRQSQSMDKKNLVDAFTKGWQAMMQDPSGPAFVVQVGLTPGCIVRLLRLFLISLQLPCPRNHAKKIKKVQPLAYPQNLAP